MSLARPLSVDRVRRDPPKTVVGYCSGFVTAALASTLMVNRDNGLLDLSIQLLFWGAVAGVLAWSVWRGSRAGWWINLINLAYRIVLLIERFPTEGGAEEVARRSSDDPVVVISGLVFSAVLLALLLSPSARAWTFTDSRD